MSTVGAEIIFKISNLRPSVVVHAFNSSTHKAEKQIIFVSLRPAV